MSLVSIDINDFSQTDFNAKQWINSVLKPCTKKPDTSDSTSETNNGDDNDEGAKDTTVLVTKLQIASDTVSRQFDQLSMTVIKSMPRIFYDLKVLSDDAKQTHEDIKTIQRELGLVEEATEESLEDRLRKPHIAKTRMEACRQLLLEESNHLEKMREEQESRKREALRKAEEEKARAEALAKEKELEVQQRVEEEKENEERLEIETEEQQKPEEEKEEKEELSEEQRMMNEALEYGHVMLPPLRQPPPKPRIQNTAMTSSLGSEHHDENNNGSSSYLQQISESMTPQVSNVFKRIGVPLDKFWQS